MWFGLTHWKIWYKLKSNWNGRSFVGFVATSIGWLLGFCAKRECPVCYNLHLRCRMARIFIWLKIKD
jgi:hypothetical protein